jgi:outer membrane receptor for monomeric catechols
VTSKRTLLAPSVNWEITDTLNWLVQYERNEHDRTPDRGIPGVDGRPADVPIESVYSDTRRDFIDDVAQSTRSRFTWDINDQWQLRQQLGYTTLDSQFDNTYVTSVKGTGDPRPLAAGSQGQQPHQQHRGRRPAANRPHRPSSAGGPGAEAGRIAPQALPERQPDPGRQPL